jgi:hypothetical protein
MTGQRIDFLSADAARFNALRDQWRSVAAGCALPAAGLRVANVLPSFVSREFGYAFPTNEDLAKEIRKSEETAKRGLNSLADAHLIERQTMVKRDEKGEAIGKLRRIFLTLPEVKGQEVKGQPVEVKGQKPQGEGSYGCSNIRDRITPDKEIRREKKVSAYVPPREGYPVGYSGDDDFLDTFDRIVIEVTHGKPIGAGEIATITQQAFDATDSSDLFMPFHWVDVCGLRTGQTAEWFRHRTGILIHRRAA